MKLTVRLLASVASCCLSLVVARSRRLATETYDYVVVGGGPGGATMARLLAQAGNTVVLLEAGQNRDQVELISDPMYTNTLPTADTGYYVQFFWQGQQLPNNVTGGDDQYTNGRLLGGGSSINGQQFVKPSRGSIQQIYDLTNDPEWSPEAVYATYKELETYSGASSQPSYRGTSGPLSVRASPTDPNASTSGAKFVQAVKNAFPDIAEIQDYNAPDTPVGVFSQWQLTQTPALKRASSSVAMLTPDVLGKITIKTGSTVVRVLLSQGKIAKGVRYSQDGKTNRALGTKGVVLSAGQFSSRILEYSGIGNPDVIGPLLAAAGRGMKKNITGVGESLVNDGIVMITMTANPNDLNTGTSADLYSGGAFLPYPGGPLTSATTSARFSQWLNFDSYTPGPTYLPQFGPVVDPGGYGDVEMSTTHTFSIGAILLNVSSTGFAHIQSADPFDLPYATTNAIQNPEDQERWNTLLQEQMVPVVNAMTAIDSTYQVINPDAATFADPDALLDWAYGAYAHSHHFAGTCKIGDLADGGVVDSNGHVHGISNLWVADASIWPIKADGNTQAIGYLVGATIAKKILAGK